MSLSPIDLATLALAWDDITKTPDVEEARHQHGDLWTVEYDGCTYAIGTEDEARAAAEAYIKDTLWAFRPEFLAQYATGTMRARWIEEIIGDRCEDANDDITDIIGDNLADLIDDAISSDGLGHFLNTYDGEHEEVTSPAGDRLIIVRVD